MIPYLLIHPDFSKREEEAKKILTQKNISQGHPNLLWIGEDKLGIKEVKKIREHLNLKPYQGQSQAVVIIKAENLTPDAQNSLLKTLEEPPEQAILVLGAACEDQLLSTITSRCQLITLAGPVSTENLEKKYYGKIDQLLKSTSQERFQFVEKLDEKEQFLWTLTSYFRHKLLENSAGGNPVPPPGWTVENIQDFLQDLIEAQKWAGQNVNTRAILEYLMLKMPYQDD
ncbi:MAG: hypothetical protein M1142_00900 [Patescibacteria group bacterium]|nr:hypothetical protein [Patescibacteria group bacterium]